MLPSQPPFEDSHSVTLEVYLEMLMSLRFRIVSHCIFSQEVVTTIPLLFRQVSNAVKLTRQLVDIVVTRTMSLSPLVYLLPYRPKLVCARVLCGKILPAGLC
jgi:hypothetical protein